MSGGVLPAVLITADRGDGEGGVNSDDGGQSGDFGGRELGLELGWGATGPGDVVVVSGSDGDVVVGIEVVPGDLTCGGESSRAIGLIGGAGVLDEGDNGPVVGAGDGDGDDLGRLGGV